MSETDVKPVGTGLGGDFNPEQKRYLEGFVAGVQIAKAAKSLSGGGAAAARRLLNRRGPMPPG